MIQLLDENVDEENEKILNFVQDNLYRRKKRLTNETNVVHDSRGHLGRDQRLLLKFIDMICQTTGIQCVRKRKIIKLHSAQ
jgi:hypothetical protein